jgi:hypothetical protein
VVSARDFRDNTVYSSRIYLQSQAVDDTFASFLVPPLPFPSLPFILYCPVSYPLPRSFCLTQTSFSGALGQGRFLRPSRRGGRSQLCMDEPKDIEAPPVPATNTAISNPTKGHDASPESTSDAGGPIPETDYSSKSENKISFMHYLVNVSWCGPKLVRTLT